MLKSIQIEGFRGIRTGKLEGLSRINILIGPNGCGKSTILEAIHITAASWFRHDVINEERISNLRKRRNEKNFSGWSFKHLYQTPVVITLSIGGANIPYKVTISPNGNSLSHDPAALENNSPPHEFLRKLLFLDAPRALSNIVENQLWKEAFLLGAHNDLMALFEKIYGRRVRNLTFTLDGDLLVDIEPVPLRLDDLGGGMRIAFRLLLAALMTGGSALLLEEFDAYQYKTSLEKLAEALCDIADRRDVQLFMTTHSLESVHAFLTAAAPRADDWIKVFPLSLDAEGELRTRGMPRSDALGLMAAGMDLRDLTSYAK